MAKKEPNTIMNTERGAYGANIFPGEFFRQAIFLRKRGSNPSFDNLTCQEDKAA
jgi:hypothetical protein